MKDQIDQNNKVEPRKTIALVSICPTVCILSFYLRKFSLPINGHDVRVVYGPNDAVELARKNPDKEVVFFAIGFETTTPSVAFEITNDPPSNFSIICTHKTVPPAMELLLSLPNLKLRGFLLPGHVCAIIGSKPFEPYAAKYKTHHTN